MELEPGPRVGAQGADRAAVHRGDPRGDGQAEAGATPFVPSGTEAVEEPLRPLRGQAGSVIGDGEGPRVAGDAGGEGDGAAARAVPHRVVEEVGGDLGEAGTVAGDDEVAGLDVGDERDVPALEGGLADGVVEQVTDADPAGGERDSPAVGPGEVEQVGDERAEAL